MRYTFVGGGPRDGTEHHYPLGHAPGFAVFDPGPVAIPDPPAPHRPVHVYRLNPFTREYVYAGMRVGYSREVS